ncbi:MAG: MT-A70 family methyltransferase [Stellaceae bacterium]
MSQSYSCLGCGGKNARTLQPGRTTSNIIVSQKRRHTHKPDELYEVIEGCSQGPFLELFARQGRPGWTQWGDECEANDHIDTSVGIRGLTASSSAPIAD